MSRDDDDAETAGLLSSTAAGHTLVHDLQQLQVRHSEHHRARYARRARARLLGAMIFVSACFGCLFAGYSTLEILGTTFRGDLGYYSLMMVYAGITPGAFIHRLWSAESGVGAPWLSARFHIRCMLQPIWPSS